MSGLRFTSLGSGSEGNALIVEASDGHAVTRILLDCGFGIREMEARLLRRGLQAEAIDAIVVTHEHGDHIAGVARLAKKYALPVWMTYGTHVASGWGRPGGTEPPEVHLIDHHTAFAIGALQVLPFPVPHDAREPAQYVFSDGARRLGVLTDVGSLTVHVVDMLKQCDSLVLECNHDTHMLEQGKYPPSLKARVGGAFGHLDNGQAAQLLREVQHPGLQHVVAAHLSRQNNTPMLARRALSDALGCSTDWIGVADQDEGVDWRSVS